MTDHAAWESGIRSVHTEAGGVVHVYVFPPSDVGALLADALMGDATAGRLIQTINQSVEQIGAAPRRKPILCLCCPRAIRRRDRFAVVVTLPGRDNPTMGIGSALCQRCAAPPGVLPRVTAALKQRIWPELRAIDHIHAAGHA